MESHLKSLIIERLEAISAREADNLVLTPVQSFDEYRSRVGRVEGIRLAIDIIQDTYSEYMKA